MAYNTETTTNGYSLLNAGLGASVVSANGKTLFSLYLAASNLTDVAYQNHLSRLKYALENMATGRTGIYNIGRIFSVKLNISLSFTLAKKQTPIASTTWPKAILLILKFKTNS